MASSPVTPVATIDETGLHLPDKGEALAYLQTAYRGVYGQDVSLDNATQDGQLLGILSLAIDDCSAGIAAAYNAFSPLTAQGAGLSRVVKINGLRRKAPSYSTADVRIVGQEGATLINGIVADASGQAWALPALVTIPFEGEIVVTATATALGAITAGANTITTFVTVQQGFQSVTNLEAATPGQPVERDPELKQRQAISTAIPAQSLLEGALGALQALSGVTRLRGYENDTNIPDANGQPGHTLAFVVEGGNAEQIAQIIAAKKPPGIGTYGSVLRTTVDAYGVPHPIRFYRSKRIAVAFRVFLKPLRGYSVITETAIKTALAAWTDALGIGDTLPLSRAYDPVNDAGTTFTVSSLTVTRDGQPFATSDLTAAFQERFVCDPGDVSFRYVT